MVDWFNIISFKTIVTFFIGFLIGRFWRLGKRIIKQIKEGDNETNG